MKVAIIGGCGEEAARIAKILAEKDEYVALSHYPDQDIVLSLSAYEELKNKNLALNTEIQKMAIKIESPPKKPKRKGYVSPYKYFRNRNVNY
jgi:hypothetical protein